MASLQLLGGTGLSEAEVKALAESIIGNLNAFAYKGAKDCSANPKFPAANAGETYIVSVAGKIGGASGTSVEKGDLLLCNTDGSAEGTQAEVGAKWDVVQTNLVVGAVGEPGKVLAADDPLLSSMVSGIAKIAPTHSLTEDFGAVSGTDATAAFTAAFATLDAGDVLLIPGNGEFKVVPSAAGIEIADGVRIVGAGRKSSVIKPTYAGTSRVNIFSPLGTVEFSDLSFHFDSAINRAAEICCVHGRESTSRISFERMDFLGGFFGVVNSWQDVVTDYELRDLLIDGENAGLASGQNRKTVMGVLHNGGGTIRAENINFRRGGCNAADRPFFSHAMYIAPECQLLMSKCRFESHILGRYIQMYNGFMVTPPSPIAPNVIRDTHFGLYNAIGEPFSMCETSEVNPTAYVDCHWDNQKCSSGAVTVKGKATFRGCRFEGESSEPAHYLTNGEGEFASTSSPDPAGAVFGGLAYEPIGDAETGLINPFIAQTCDAAIANAAATPNANTNLMMKVHLAKERTVKKVIAQVTTKGATLTAGKNEIGLYSVATDKLIARTADQSAAWESTGEKSANLVAEAGQSLTLPPGDYYLALISNGTTRPTFTRISPGTSTATSVNSGYPTAYPRAATGAAASEKLASLLKGEGSLTAGVNIIWIGLA